MSTTNLPTTIRTLSQPDPNIPKVILTTSPLPALTPGSKTEHLIKVHATSPCADELIWPRNDPHLFSSTIVPCYDLSGTVIQAPSDSPFPPGTDIWCSTPPGRPGNGREYTIATTEELATRPKCIDAVTAAGVPLSAVTAVQALFVHGGIRGFRDGEEGKRENATKKILVIAAAGGVGIWLLQLAREAGVGGIVAVCGTDNVGFVKELGATEVIDYRKQSVEEFYSRNKNKRVDLVIDCKGGKSLEEAWSCVRQGGILLSICEPPENRKPAGCTTQDIQSSFFILTARGSDLTDVSRLLEEGKVVPFVDSVWNLDDYEKAYERVGEGHTRGKVIIVP